MPFLGWSPRPSSTIHSVLFSSLSSYVGGSTSPLPSPPSTPLPPPRPPPTISLIGSRYYPHRISADDLFNTHPPDLNTDFEAILLHQYSPIQPSSPLFTPSLPAFSPHSPWSSSSQTSTSSSTSCGSTTSIDLDYLREDPYQDINGETASVSSDDFNDIDVDALETGVVVEDRDGKVWVWWRCFCANIQCTGYTFRPMLETVHAYGR